MPVERRGQGYRTAERRKQEQERKDAETFKWIREWLQELLIGPALAWALGLRENQLKLFDRIDTEEDLSHILEAFGNGDDYSDRS